jgi:hypothetical protein
MEKGRHGDRETDAWMYLPIAIQYKSGEVPRNRHFEADRRKQ